MDISCSRCSDPIRRVGGPNQILQRPIEIEFTWVGQGPSGLGDVLTDIPQF